MSNDIEIYLLGEIRFCRGNTVISDSSSRAMKLWSVLCYLILHRNREVSQSELIELFWPEEDRSHPLSALKMLILRIRNLLAPLFDGDEEPIVSLRGAYCWNPNIFCRVDAEIFDQLCLQANSPMVSSCQKMKIYQEAVTLYKGDLLPKHDRLWIMSMRTRYHNQYLNAVKAYAAMLESAGQYGDMEELCLQAIKLHPVDEQLHILVIRSYLRQKRNADALHHYEKSTKLLYQSLGVRPSQELQSLYIEIMAEEKSLEDDLEIIMNTMNSAPVNDGAFVCEYGLFTSIYQLEARRISRNGSCLHVALLTLSVSDADMKKLSSLNTVMEQLQEIIAMSLRQSDVLSRYNKTQFIAMLPYAALEDSFMIMERIVTEFHRYYQKEAFKLSYELRGLESIC